MAEGTKLTMKFFWVEVLFWGIFAALPGMASMYLLDHGFSNALIGALIAGSGVGAAVLQPLFGSYADRPESASLKKILTVFTAVLLIVSVLLLMTGKYPVLTGLLYGTAVAFLQVMTPLLNAMGAETLNQGKKLNYGLARGGGSAGYAAAAYLMGVLAEKFGTAVIPLGSVLMLAGLLAAILIFPFEKCRVPEKEKAEGAEEQRKGSSLLKKYPRFFLVMAGCVFIYIGHTVLNSFTYQIMSSKGGGRAETGFMIALAAILELVPMLLFGYMQKKVRCDIWFRITGIFFTLKTAATLLAPGIRSLYAAQLFQVFGWGLITVSAVYYVNSIMKREDAVKGQTFMNMTYTAGCVIGSLAGGRIIDVWSVSAMLLFGTIASAIGMVILLFGTEKVCKKDENRI
ncbi:MAG: MFS transporter [Eubacteriales bacterium]|nr:MFS transporter [Eubacteriales bacterium]